MRSSGELRYVEWRRGIKIRIKSKIKRRSWNEWLSATSQEHAFTRHAGWHFKNK